MCQVIKNKEIVTSEECRINNSFLFGFTVGFFWESGGTGI
jgi:hypothetical protein